MQGRKASNLGIWLQTELASTSLDLGNALFYDGCFKSGHLLISTELALLEVVCSKFILVSCRASHTAGIDLSAFVYPIAL